MMKPTPKVSRGNNNRTRFATLRQTDAKEYKAGRTKSLAPRNADKIDHTAFI